MRPQTIQIFLPTGSPTSVKEAELTSRLIKTLYFPRTAFDKAAQREMVHYTGVYFLFGEDEEGNEMAYIGEGEDCWERIKDHQRKKEFWTDCIIAVTKTDEYNKADAKYLEHYCLEIAQKIGRYKFENSKASSRPSITEAREADLLDNFDTIKTLTGALGFPILEERKSSSIDEADDLFICKGKDAIANALFTDEGVVVLKGSTCNLEESKTAGSWVIGMRKKLIDRGVLVQNGKVWEFTKDELFKSPSAAAATVLARRANGWMEWKDKSGKTMDELKRN